MSGEEVTGAELQAYVDGQLAAAQRVGVEAYLERHPAEAAAVMEGLRLRDELQLFLADDGAWPVPPRTEASGRRLARAFLRASLAPRLRTALAAAALVALGWFGHARLGGAAGLVGAERPVEALAEDAAQAYRVVQIKVVAAGAPRTAGPLPGTTAAGEGRPSFPAGFRHVVTEAVPWDGGTAELRLFVTPRGDTLVLLVARVATAGVERPASGLVDGVATVSWQSGRTAYALSGDVPASDLLSIARSIAPVT